MPQGFLSIIMHSHLPYVRHPEHEHSLEEKWFFEGMVECYLPLLKVMEGLRKDRVDFRLTFSLSPTLLSMMEDDFLRQRFINFLEKMQRLSRREEERNRDNPVFGSLARMYRDYLDEMSGYYHGRCKGRPARVFREFQEDGCIEIITCAATHGFLPLLDIQREAVYAQIAAGVQYHTAVLGEHPRGIWLPECGYSHGIEEVLEEMGLQYFITATHGVLYASPRPKYGIFSPIITENGMAVFGRDSESSKQVWSSREGYPGDCLYREFYRDVGYDLEMDYIGEYLHPPGLRGDTGLKYYRITGDSLEYKEPYQPEKARAKAAEHAGNFMFNREKQVEFLAGIMGRPPIIVSPYDSELFGHWWFEGPIWLDYLCRKIAFDQNTIKLITPGEYLDLGFPLQVSQPNPSSWGDKGYNEVWLNGKNDWIYSHLHQAAADMVALATDYPDAGGALKQALTQAARELLLAQSSDWPFIMTVGTMVQYAEQRFLHHMLSFRNLHDQVRSGNIDTEWLGRLESVDNLFPHLDYRLFQRMDTTTPIPVG